MKYEHQIILYFYLTFVLFSDYIYIVFIDRMRVRERTHAREKNGKQNFSSMRLGELPGKEAIGFGENLNRFLAYLRTFH